MHIRHQHTHTVLLLGLSDVVELVSTYIYVRVGHNKV